MLINLLKSDIIEFTFVTEVCGVADLSLPLSEGYGCILRRVLARRGLS